MLLLLEWKRRPLWSPLGVLYNRTLYKKPFDYIYRALSYSIPITSIPCFSSHAQKTGLYLHMRTAMFLAVDLHHAGHVRVELSRVQMALRGTGTNRRWHRTAGADRKNSARRRRSVGGGAGSFDRRFIGNVLKKPDQTHDSDEEMVQGWRERRFYPPDESGRLDLRRRRSGDSQ